MCGSNNICNTKLWQGTSMAAEGHLAYVLFGKAKEEGMVGEVKWQLNRTYSLVPHWGVCSLMDFLIGRCFLQGMWKDPMAIIREYKGKEVVNKGFINLHAKNCPAIKPVKCCCKGYTHSKKCGCFNVDFLAGAKRNHFSTLKQSGKSADEYAHNWCAWKLSQSWHLSVGQWGWWKRRVWVSSTSAMLAR